jgi:hypothetical protein
MSPELVLGPLIDDPELMGARVILLKDEIYGLGLPRPGHTEAR